MPAQIGRFRHGGCVINCQHDRIRLAGHFTVSSATAAGVQNTTALQVGQLETSFRLKRRTVFVVMRDFVLVPLQTKAGEVLRRDESWNAVVDREGRCAILA